MLNHQFLDKPLVNPSGCRARLTSFWGAIWGLFFILGQWDYSLTYPFYRFYSRDIMDYYGCSLNDGCPSHHGCCKTKSWPSSHPWRVDDAFGGTTQWLQTPHHQLWVKNQSEKLNLVGSIPTPLKNMSQLGRWNSQLNGKSSNSMVPVTTNQYIYTHIPKPIYSWFTHY